MTLQKKKSFPEIEKVIKKEEEKEKKRVNA